MPESGFCLVLSTAPDIGSAEKITSFLLDKKLAACVTRLPGAVSQYSWKGKTECSEEVVLLVKTKASLYGCLQSAILEAHPYECPEILRFDIAGGFPDYLAWLSEQVGEGGAKSDE